VHNNLSTETVQSPASLVGTLACSIQAPYVSFCLVAAESINNIAFPSAAVRLRARRLQTVQRYLKGAMDICRAEKVGGPSHMEATRNLVPEHKDNIRTRGELKAFTIQRGRSRAVSITLVVGRVQRSVAGHAVVRDGW
jgi:hypothetical protein